ncbi:SufD family Fe-S cluster assembly protein [Parerythrobacter jejuensis]|uniref:SufD family Fe-S cluster assembly protein n=1 Tax=Parerythrobacter jejuensis TaxID=795812 RepID=A0A845AP84_9SPHN|nr:SufD family Fe-S cluster assembly protein [Parerythrobacter jejuensis]MXP30993.1 SufD family Fe-S cluster assembly protein [Parerythrobacter jejuensis]MXP33753.1 SufD family Fe-S cluster assembly protein [Parerythrobacter jejuensis]
MTEAGTLPTRRDEAWRYADIDAVTQLGLDALADWQEISLAAGESHKQCIVVGSDSPELHRIRLSLGEGARAEIFASIVGPASCRFEVEVRLAKGAHFEFGGVTIGGGEAIREFVTHAVHAEPEGTSNQVVRAVHWDQASGNFLGQIDVVRDAQKTDAAQDFKGLLLNKGASANAVPQLEIFADDVKCAHGATVGQLDEMARYYMAARGIPPQTAKKLLVRAFLADAFVAIEDEAEQERLLDAALDALGNTL